jgi:hypothetical protein
MEPTVVKTAAKKMAVKDYNPADYEAPNESASISVDDICVKAQNP